jgi:hypothetical protein
LDFLEVSYARIACVVLVIYEYIFISYVPETASALAARKLRGRPRMTDHFIPNDRTRDVDGGGRVMCAGGLALAL